MCIRDRYMSDVRHFLTVNGNAALLDGSSSLGTGCYKSGFYKKADQVLSLIHILFIPAI